MTRHKLLRISLPDIALLASIVIHLILCPFTKVEESFNMQAGYDLLHLNFLTELKDFDHLEFSGVVPRTFVGALTVTLLSYPLQVLNDVALPLLGMLPLASASIYRSGLGALVWLSFCFFRNAVHDSEKFSPRTSSLFSVLLALQFHIPFYASRSLPNTFALCVVMVAYGFWFRKKSTTCLYFVGIATVLFRCDMLVLLAPMALQMLLCERISFMSTFLTGAAVCLLTLLVSVPIDSFFWTRPLWPEGEVLFFNTVENRSSEWGTFPFHWYFSSALPKALHTCIPLVAVGLLNPYGNSRGERTAVWYYLFPTLCFLVLYSFLPHKELRFVFPAIPMFTLVAARGLDSLLPANWFAADGSAKSESERPSSLFHRTVGVVLLTGLVLASLAVTSVFSLASQHNYPGGEALMQLNDHILSTTEGVCAPTLPSSTGKGSECVMTSTQEGERKVVKVHIDAAAAMSGINRFGQLQGAVEYSKNESKALAYEEFDWLITGDPSKKEVADHFSTWLEVAGFSGMYVDRQVLQTIKSVLRTPAEAMRYDETDLVSSEAGSRVQTRLGAVWSAVKRGVRRYSPLRMRFKHEIFVMKRNAAS